MPMYILYTSLGVNGYILVNSSSIVCINVSPNVVNALSFSCASILLQEPPFLDATGNMWHLTILVTLTVGYADWWVR